MLMRLSATAAVILSAWRYVIMHSMYRNKLAISAFVFPTLFIFTFVVAFPVLQTILRSLYDWNGLLKPTFIGFQNYKDLFHDDAFYTSLKNGMIFMAIITTYQIGLGSILAFIVNDIRNTKIRNLFKNSYFLPVVISVTVVCQMWIFMFNSDAGLINRFLKMIGNDYRQNWLNDGKHGIFVMSFVNAWQFMGYHFIILYSAIKSIPSEIFEAATIDGASPVKRYFHVTIPLLAENYKVCLIFAITSGLKAFEQMWIMTQGGPGTSAYTLTVMMYQAAFRRYEFGYGCAIAVILIIECLLATVIINTTVAREKYH